MKEKIKESGKRPKKAGVGRSRLEKAGQGGEI